MYVIQIYNRIFRMNSSIHSINVLCTDIRKRILPHGGNWNKSSRFIKVYLPLKMVLILLMHCVQRGKKKRDKLCTMPRSICSFEINVLIFLM